MNSCGLAYIQPRISFVQVGPFQREEWRMRVPQNNQIMENQAHPISTTQNPQANVNTSLPNFHHSKILMPFFTTLKCLFLLSHTVLYVPQQVESYVVKQGSIFRQVACLIWQVLLLSYVVWAISSDTFEGQRVHGALTKMAYISFVTFYINLTYNLWRKSKETVKLINDGDGLLNALSIRQRTWLNMDCLVWPVILITAASNAIFTFAMLLEVTVNWEIKLEDRLSWEVIIWVINGIVHSYCSFFYDTFCHVPLNKPGDLVPLKVYIIFFFLFALAVTVEVSWVLMHLFIAYWGVYFKRIVGCFMKKIMRGGLSLREAIKGFNEISVLIERFNTLYGSILFTIVISSMLYKTISFSGVLKGENPGWIVNILTFMNYLPFIILLFTSAEVHRMITTFPYVVKKAFILQGTHPSLSEDWSLHGMCAIYHDILSKSVGFKGLEFFSVSYSFITQVVGVIFTYAIITLQLSYVTKTAKEEFSTGPYNSSEFHKDANVSEYSY